jgi:long-subunit fatty acid transport protein
MKHFFLLILSHLSILLQAQIAYQLVSGASSLSMGGAGVMLQNEQAMFHNPAGLVGVPRSTVLLTSEMRFGVTEIKPIGCAFIMPTSSSFLGFSFQNLTVDSYRESKLGVAYARRLTSKFNIGVQMDYEQLKIDAYGSAHLLNINLGFQTLIFKDLALAASLFNPIAMKVGESEKAPSVFRLGLGYSINPKTLLCLETEKDIATTASFKLGFAYKVIETLTLRCGYRTTPSVFSFGLGYKINKDITVDCALANHAYLGFTPALNLCYALGKNKTVATN